MTTRPVRIGTAEVGGETLALIAGPCVIESEDLCLEIAARVRAECVQRGVPYIFKASFDKANRMAQDSYRGPGLARGLEILGRVREAVGVPVLTDIHEPEHAEAAARVVDVLQIPAFLCRQTDLLLAAGRTRLPVNLKKGQFIAPTDMQYAVEKITSTGNTHILLTERGTMFGYRDLVVDMRALHTLKSFGYPVIFDATHSVQEPGAAGGTSGGAREFVPTLVRAACAVGIHGLFIETHPAPEEARSDRATQWPLAHLGALLDEALAVHRARVDQRETTLL